MSTDNPTPAERMALCSTFIGDVNPWPFTQSVGKSKKIGDYLNAFDQFLDAVGIKYFSALEISTPSSDSQQVAARTGSDASVYNGQFVLVYPVWLWVPMAAAAKLADEVRVALGAPITCRNGIRPWWINQQVASSGIVSDHPMTAAVDLDLSSSGDLKAAHARAEELYTAHASDLEISMGQGDRVIHFGVHSPHGHRRWSY
jgi:hypothetical protein